jgi:IS1 family transposase
VNTLSIEKQTRVIAALTEGCSIRATERLTDVNRETVMYLGVRVGESCARLHDAMMRNLQVGVIEIDEQWAFIGKKQKRVRSDDAPELGDTYLFTALGATSKAILSYVVGKRNGETTDAFVRDLRFRVVNRPQITADGFPPYTHAVVNAFGGRVDFAQLQKVYQATPGNEAAVRYSPGSIRGVEKTLVCGDPDESKISTSYVERFNLTTRMQSRRFTRLTNGFSRKLVNHRAAIALYIAHYNLCRYHEAIRCTPAMALGVTDHIWSIEELITAAVSAPPTLPEPPRDPPPSPPLPPRPPRYSGMSAAKAMREKGVRRTTLTIIKGGRRPK